MLRSWAARDPSLVEGDYSRAALLGSVACGAFVTLPDAAARLVRPGGSVTARPGTKAFHDAKYAVYLQLYDDMELCRAAMRVWR